MFFGYNPGPLLRLEGFIALVGVKREHTQVIVVYPRLPALSQHYAHRPFNSIRRHWHFLKSTGDMEPSDMIIEIIDTTRVISYINM